MVTRKEYITKKITSDCFANAAPGAAIAIDDKFIQYIQDMALDIYLSLHKDQIINDPVRYIMTYCPYDKEENRYAEQYEGTNEQIAEATMYIDMAYYVVYWDMANNIDVWEYYVGRR